MSNKKKNVVNQAKTITKNEYKCPVRDSGMGQI